MVDPKGAIIGKYRKVHLPGHHENEPWRAFQHLEKRYFECGNLGFPAYRMQVAEHKGIFGMALCNDRRWPRITSYNVCYTKLLRKIITLDIWFLQVAI